VLGLALGVSIWVRIRG